MRKPVSTLYWSPSSVRYYDAVGSRWLDVEPPVSEISARVWCAANGFEFRMSARVPVTAGEVIRGLDFRASGSMEAEHKSKHQRSS